MGSDTRADSVPAGGRILSIDALRGFDMFWIMGGEDVARAWARWGNWRTKEQIETQLEHVPWEGFRFYDLIFPLFLFIVGVVLPFSLGKLREPGTPKSTLYGRILRRTVLLFALGLLCNNVLRLDFANLRVAGVLQRIALCYGLAAVLVVNLCPWRQAVAAAALLLGYWALLVFVPAPGSLPGDFTKEGNLPGYIDRHWLPGKIMPQYYGFGDNEGILSTFPAVATVLLGALAGAWLRASHAPRVKTAGLAVAGVACLALGLVWAHWFPVIKNIWTSSFVLVAGGWSLLLLALFYGVIDGLGFRRWSFFFVVIGANALTIYVLPHFVDFEKAADFFFGGLLRYTGNARPAFETVAVFAVEWLLLLFLYRRRLFLRV